MQVRDGDCILTSSISKAIIMCVLCAAVMKQADSSPFARVEDTDRHKLREAYFKMSADVRKVSFSGTQACPVRFTPAIYSSQ